MLDLTYFILNSSSPAEPSINPQTSLGLEQFLELTDDSIDKDNLILDPSSFVLLFAEILANTPVKSEINSSSSGLDPNTANASTADLENMGKSTNKEDMTNRMDLARSENQTSIKNELPINSGTLNIAIDNQAGSAALQKNVPSLLDNQFNTGSNLEQFPPDSLENNVALAWINSENFQPPMSASATNELADEVYPESEAPSVELAESNKLTEIVKKDAPPKNSKILDPIPVNDKVTPNSKDDWYKSDQFATTPLSEMDSVSLKQELQINSNLSENGQYIIQPNAFANKENQIATNIPEVKTLEIPVDLNHSQWTNKFSEHIIWLGHQGIKSALIKIHPEDWGPLEISIKVVKDSASVNINSHNSHVRDIVDQALPKLREMMSEQGLNLSDVHIGSDADSRPFAHHNNVPSEEVLMINPDDEIQLTPLTKRPQEGIIDYFA